MLLFHSYNEIRKDHSIKTAGGMTLSLGYSEEANDTIEEDYPAHRADTDYFPYWCFVISLPFTVTILVLHLILHNLYIFGVIVCIIYQHTYIQSVLVLHSVYAPGSSSPGDKSGVWQWSLLGRWTPSL